ncbi:amine oxidase [Aspergillus saccharolyticus JOP 1030-1]|uniref:Amine oxidase n=1 Tax=Aspergillus saccharolyticus JOP 1030-1 TaxID=1450539 RepID=A0A318ZIT1_9EURO|nr:amine oxidase [Aspergillus saccharolyticus JOP 1030-1]PYH46254.1 amine oxidase [Aspergillus saccharolyticus JOP 1030-1]
MISKVATTFVLTLLLGPIWLGGVVSANDPSPSTNETVIRRGFCIIGGGAAGTYAAIRLRELGQDVVVVEKTDRLGGQVQTYFDPDTGVAIDYGVRNFDDSPETRSFFEHLNISVDLNTRFEGLKTLRYDFRTGVSVPPYPGSPRAAIERYTAELQRYSYLSQGWNLSDQVAEPLLQPFRDFVRDHDLGAALETMTMLSQGIHYLLDYVTVYPLKVVSLNRLNGLQHGYLGPSSRNVSEVYHAAQQELGEDVLINSTVIHARRSDDKVHRLTVESDNGERFIIEADATIVAMPPKTDDLEALDLDSLESFFVRQFQYGYVYTGVIRDSNLPHKTQILNRGLDTPYGLPKYPCTSSIVSSAVPGIHLVTYGSAEEMSEDDVREAMVDDIFRLQDGGLNARKPTFLAFATHSPFDMYVSRQAIEAGFYQDVSDSQGHRNTYWIGAAWESPDSSAIWRSIDRLLPAIISD